MHAAIELARDNRVRHELDDLVDDVSRRSRLVQRMRSFVEFAQGFGPPDRQNFQDGLWWRHDLKLAENVVLRICGFNTALLCADDQDQGKLRVGKRQIAELLLPTPGVNELIVALSHHPVTGKWLADEVDVRGRLNREVAIHLFGHLHEADSEHARYGWGTGCLRIAAGAVHAEGAPLGGPPSIHGYTFGALIVRNDGQLVVRLWPRQWQIKPHRYIADNANIVEAKGYAEHSLQRSLPRPLRAKGLHPGDVLGSRYRIEGELGKGGVGQVFRALDVRSGRTVAVKVLNPDGSQPTAQRHNDFFQGPARISAVQHPAIARILDPNPDPSSPFNFYVMDLVDGEDLGKMYTGKPRSDEETIDLLIAIGEGLQAAHKAGLLHRDLKPSNVILTRNGRIQIIDFDTVRERRDDTATRSGGRLVSYLYASPEMHQNQPIGEQADIYSLAVSGIFLRSGAHPTISDLNLMHERAALLECGENLRKILVRGCARRAADRFVNMGELLDSLRRAKRPTRAGAAVSPAEQKRSVQETPSAVRGAKGGKNKATERISTERGAGADWADILDKEMPTQARRGIDTQGRVIWSLPSTGKHVAMAYVYKTHIVVRVRRREDQHDAPESNAAGWYSKRHKIDSREAVTSLISLIGAEWGSTAEASAGRAKAPSSDSRGGVPAPMLATALSDEKTTWVTELASRLPGHWSRETTAKGHPVWSGPSGHQIVRVSRQYGSHIVMRIRSPTVGGDAFYPGHTGIAINDASSTGWLTQSWRVDSKPTLDSAIDAIRALWIVPEQKAGNQLAIRKRPSGAAWADALARRMPVYTRRGTDAKGRTTWFLPTSRMNIAVAYVYKNHIVVRLRHQQGRPKLRGLSLNAGGWYSKRWAVHDAGAIDSLASIVAGEWGTKT